MPDVVVNPITDLYIEIYDAGWYERGITEETGDSRWGEGSNDPFANTHFSVRAVDSTPNDPTDNPIVAGCDLTLAPEAQPALKNEWGGPHIGTPRLCHIDGGGGPVTPGIWIVHVETTGVGGGSSHYSLAAYSNGGEVEPRVYGINDMSIWNNSLDDDEALLYLVEVDSIHAGAILELQFFDPGDANGDSWMRVQMPDGDDDFDTPDCVWESTDYSGTVTDSGNGPCDWQTTDEDDPVDKRLFNNQWITALIDIPDDYTCNAGADGCFWFMELDLDGPTERTVWRARVIGNPVKLVP